MKRASTFAPFRRARLRPLILALCGLGHMGASRGQVSNAMPISEHGDDAIKGVAHLERAGNDDNPIYNITQTSAFAAWRFSSFNIGANGTLNNTAASRSAVTLFHVVSPGATNIAGRLTANNRVFIVNPDGIHVRSGAKLQASGLVLSAKDIDPKYTANNYDLLEQAVQGKMPFISFNVDGRSYGYGGYGGTYGGDSIVDIEQGASLVATDGGSIFLIADNVRNAGTLTAQTTKAGNGGHIGLIAADSVDLGLPVGDSGFITLVGFDRMQNGSDGTTRVALNTGTIDAPNGEVTLAGAGYGYDYGNRFEVSPPDSLYDGESGLAPSGAYNTGTITARGSDGKSGKVTLEGTSGNGVAASTGVIDASAGNDKGLGGTIKMSARNVMVVGSQGSEGTQGVKAELLARGTGGRIELDHDLASTDLPQPTQLDRVAVQQDTQMNTERAMPSALAVAAVANPADTRSAGVVVANATIEAGSGGVGITGSGVALNAALPVRNGVTVEGSTITSSGGVLIDGTTQASGAGVRLQSSTIGGNAVEIYGRAAPSSSGGAVGVNVKNDVVVNVGVGGLRMLGLSVGLNTIGLRINDLTVTTSGAPLMTLVGQSVGSTGPGLQIDGNAPGLSLHDVAGESFASSADVVIGASASASADDAILIGTVPALRTTGKVNFRPIGLDGNEIRGPVIDADFLGTGIHVGANLANDGTNFNVDPAWFNGAFNNTIQPGMGTVIGSTGHTGRITVADGALDGAGNVSLQNQGQGSQGIELGAQAQQGVAKLNLLTTGDISQTGALRATELNVKVGPGSTVALNNPGNVIGKLNVDGMATPAGITPAAVTNSGTSGIPGFETGEGFQTLGIQAVTTNREQTTVYDIQRERDIDMTFEGTDLMNELRTDVYVHGQLSRPQLCTPANTGAATSVADGGADPLALEWGKVRRGPQLTNCAGMKPDSSCAAF